MELSSVQNLINASRSVRKMGAIALGMLALFLLVATISELRAYTYIGAGIQPANTITVTGEGTVTAIPDTATFTFTVDETAADVATAQGKATTAANAVIDYLKKQGIDDKDIQTTSYNVNPQYQYSSQVCVTNSYCPPTKQTISGYEVSQTVTVKVNDITKAGTLLAGVGTHGVSDVSGLSFTVANQDALDAQARDKAITDAQSKAKDLAKALGVSLIRVTGFNENSNRYPAPMYATMSSGAGMQDKAVSVPQIPTGQNTTTSDVSVTYEIR